MCKAEDWLLLSRDSSAVKNKEVSRSPWPLVTLAVCLALILTMRLFYLQVLQYEHYLSQSENYRIKREVIEASRGFIYDRNGEVIAKNRMSYSITVDPYDRDKFDESIPHLAALVPDLPKFLGIANVSSENIVDTIKIKSRESNNPIKIIRDADFRLLSIVEEHNHELQGIGGVFDQARHYPYGPLAAHVIGYMSELTPEEYKLLHDKGYEYGHSIGKSGIEKYYEHILKGTNGVKYVEMNYLSRKLGVPREVEPIPSEVGKNLKLTLDVRLQMAAEEAFGDTLLGALVALDPNNGEVLVMASSPSFDPNEFTHAMTRERYASLANDPDKPLFNRAIQATYPPGSTFKMLTALAGLENGYTEKSRFKSCKGSYYFGRSYECWKEGGHGSLNMAEAITQSCNVYFYQLGRKLPLETWRSYGVRLGFGEKTGIDMIGEKPGLLPDMNYYNRQKEGYSPGKILNLAIGQGENLVTILQLAHYTGIIATEGLDATPHLVMSDYEPQKRVTGISPESFRVVKKGMYGVIHSPRGTARSARIPSHEIAGKTGTVENPHGADHKIFIAFAPYDNPTVAVACVAENAGDYEGSCAVYIVKQFLKEYFTHYYDTKVATND